MAEKFREIEAYLKSMINQARMMQEETKDNGIESAINKSWFKGQQFAYEDVYKILFSNEKNNLAE